MSNVGDTIAESGGQVLVTVLSSLGNVLAVVALVVIVPVVAIGGLTLDRALLCLKSGADIASVVGDIVNHADPLGQAKAWIAATRKP